VVREAPTKSQVNRAGKRFARFRSSVLEEGRRLADLDHDEIDRIGVAIQVIRAFREAHAYPLRMANANLRYYVSGYGDHASVTQRLKKFTTMIDKLRREPTMQLAGMEDIAGVRAVLPDQAAVDAVARRLRKNWRIHRVRDYVREPKASGYRAVHVIAVKKAVFVEVQLRTTLQDEWANQVEQDSRALAVDYKSGAGAHEVLEYYEWVSRLLAMQERGEQPSREFIDELLHRYRLAMPFLSAGPTS
jgi:putative GTP pyrophosphokinase